MIIITRISRPCLITIAFVALEPRGAEAHQTLQLLLRNQFRHVERGGTGHPPLRSALATTLHARLHARSRSWWN